MQTEVKTDQKEPFQTLKYPEDADNFDRIIIELYNRKQKPMSFTTLRNELFREIFGVHQEFITRLEKLKVKCKKSNCKVKIDLWREQKETLQIGTEEDKKKAMEKHKKED